MSTIQHKVKSKSEELNEVENYLLLKVLMSQSDLTFDDIIIRIKAIQNQVELMEI